MLKNLLEILCSAAAEAIGQRMTTIEALTNSPVQEAFVAHNAIQCGYCTPGFVMNGHALLHIHPDANDDVIEEWMSSNLCRCTGYQEIQSAMKALFHSKQNG